MSVKFKDGLDIDWAGISNYTTHEVLFLLLSNIQVTKYFDLF